MGLPSSDMWYEREYQRQCEASERWQESLDILKERIDECDTPDEVLDVVKAWAKGE